MIVGRIAAKISENSAKTLKPQYILLIFPIIYEILINPQKSPKILKNPPKSSNLNS
jgi:hypothetical protein